MAITEAFTGSELVTTTEWSLTTDTAGPDVELSDGVFQCWVDLNALIAGDNFQLRLYETVIAAGTQRRVTTWSFVGASPEPNFSTPSFILMNGWDFTLIKIAGTDRTIVWSIRKVA